MSQNRVQLIDIDPSLQVNVDWDQVKAAGFDGAYIKSSMYSSTRMHSFHAVAEAAKKAGVAVGAYHFAFLGSDPTKQASFFYEASEAIGKSAGELPPMLDVEFRRLDENGKPITPKAAVEWWETCLSNMQVLWYPTAKPAVVNGDIVMGLTNPRKVVTYTYPYFCTELGPDLVNSKILGAFPLAIANYRSSGQTLLPWFPGENGDPSEPWAIPKPWKTWTIWQYSGNRGRKVPGIVNDTDRNLFNGGVEAFEVFCGVYKTKDMDKDANVPLHEIIPRVVGGEDAKVSPDSSSGDRKRVIKESFKDGIQ